MLKVDKLSKTFTSGNNSVHAVRDVAFTLDSGKLAAIVGKSGSGKSTLLALLGTLDQADEGSIAVEHDEVTKFSGQELLRYRRSTIGFIFQSYNLIPNLTALENVMLPMEFNKISSEERKKRATHLLSQVGLTKDKLTRRPGKLSGGEQQRVAIARALANQPKLILADEPTGNLDTQTAKTIIELLHHLAKTEHTTIIIVTHDTEVAKQADEIYQLQDGRLHKQH
ncbi:MAG: ABC transporter ATP-binding protein [Candidatus Nomurabacteria bacterium]|nr:MAG: ABC transporter ATP-binding protein [Candidatus Nomurabacteria bacterium]